MNKRV